ncbi:MAG: inositol monophosphatase [Actinomycetota bacterium]|nr:MAG: inositol monophosphatase [Actinomycetota bacterium]
MDARAIAERAAALGGEVIRRAGPAGGRPDVKGVAGDYVTAVDRESEAAVAAFLLEETGIPVLGEEGTGRGALRGAGEAPEGAGAPPERAWIVDPLDGTTNFVHGFHAVGVSVALLEDGRPVVGAVHAPFLGETWSAASGEGCWVRRPDGTARRARVSDLPVQRAVVATGFPFRRKQLLERYLAMLRRALERFEDLRRPGAASLDLAWVASGVFEGFFELALAPWDVAAGGLLIQEAGGVVTDWTGGDGWLSGDILAGSPAVHEELLRLAGEVAAGP